MSSARDKIAQAQEVLRDLGFDRERTNERAALVLLALLDVEPDGAWNQARAPMLGVTRIMAFVREHYAVDWAPNTRETVRRFTLHQFVDAHLVERNADDPARPVNSPKSSYQVRSRAVALVHAYGTPAYHDLLAAYLAEMPGLRAQYAAARQMNRLPVVMPSGQTLDLSPGGQNVLIKAMIEDFCDYFTPGGSVLYVGDVNSA